MDIPETNQSTLNNMNHIKRVGSDRPPVVPFAVINCVIIDKSSSMTSMQGLQIDMNEKLINDIYQQAQKSKTKTYFTFITFNQESQIHFCNEDILSLELPNNSDLKKILMPNGTTRFIDTVLEALDSIEDQKNTILNSLAPEVRKLNPNIVTILNCTTDGVDNRSLNNELKLKDKMTKYRKNGGQALLLAANMDAQVVGKRFGFSEDNSLTVHNSDPNAIEYAFDCVISASREISSGQGATPYSQVQRSCSQPSDPQFWNNHLPSPPINIPPPPALCRQKGNSNQIISNFTPPSPTMLPVPSINLQNNNVRMRLRSQAI